LTQIQNEFTATTPKKVRGFTKHKRWWALYSIHFQKKKIVPEYYGIIALFKICKQLGLITLGAIRAKN
jgi:hypothetical protein